MPPGTNSKLGRVKEDDVLDKIVSWPVTISYFDSAKTEGEGTPAYELTFRLFANGVSRRLKIDYGDFVVNGNLRELKFFKATSCN